MVIKHLQSVANYFALALIFLTVGTPTLNAATNQQVAETFHKLFVNCLFNKEDNHPWSWYVNKFVQLAENNREAFKEFIIDPKVTDKDAYLDQFIITFKGLAHSNDAWKTGRVLAQYRKALPKKTQLVLKEKSIKELVDALKFRLSANGVTLAQESLLQKLALFVLSLLPERFLKDTSAGEMEESPTEVGPTNEQASELPRFKYLTGRKKFKRRSAYVSQTA